MRTLPDLQHVSQRLGELEGIIPKSLRSEWDTWRETWPNELAAQLRFAELWAQLSWWERRAELAPEGPAFQRATAELVRVASPAEVGGVLSEHSAGDLLDWMVELDEQLRQLDADIQDAQRAAPYWGQGDASMWQVFLYGVRDQPPEVPRFGWFTWYAEHSPFWDRWYNTEQRWSEMKRWDAAFKAWHSSFVSAGGKPTQQNVIVGPDEPPEEPLTAEELHRFGVASLFVLGLFAVGYTVRAFK